MEPINQAPWYERTRRWGQTNLTEIDPLHCDIDFWRAHWRRTRVQGIVVNAGGIVAYYPSRFELHYRAEHLGERDLFGEITHAAHEDGLAVLARMDSNRATEEFYRTQPDWFAVNRAGEPYVAQGRYLACVNGPYYERFIPELLREVIERYHPDGFTDNSWSGLNRQSVCYCRHCTEQFAAATGLDLPSELNWEDPSYRQWMRWSYQCRVRNWDLTNSVTREHGGPHCVWLGMVNANPMSTHCSFVDLKAIAGRSPLIMCDHQSRDRLNGFEQNGLNGKLLHGLAGWDTLIPESMAMYVRGEQAFRRASCPPLESRTWMACGFAGGISPWWHHVGALQEDRRQFRTAEPLMQWHEANEQCLYNREPVANVGLLWSQQNIDFYGRDDVHEKVALPWRGFTSALTRARIPFLPLHLDDLPGDTTAFDVLILPDLAAMTDEQCAAARCYVESGGSLVATGGSSLLDEWGDRRDDFALADVLGVRDTGRRRGVEGEHTSDWEVQTAHNYLRLPPANGRHEMLSGFDETDILPFGGTLQEVEALPGTETIASYVPAFPIYPPEFSWMREPQTDLPVVTVREHPAGGRIVYLAADIDRCYGRQQLPDHGDLLANAVRWAARGCLPLDVAGPGYLDCHLYQQSNRLILHIVNLSGCRAWPGYVEEHLPVGPVTVKVKLAPGFEPSEARLRVSGQTAGLKLSDDSAIIRIPTIHDHELLVLE
jgi:putative glycosyl hydrolase-like family 6 (GHL6) protein